MHRCPYCMRQSESVICPHCGKSANVPQNSSMLPVGSIISGGSGQQYQIGAPLGQGGFGITYVGLDCTLGRRVAIKEYFPTRCAWRTEDHRVVPRQGMEDIYRGGIKSFLEEARMLAALEDNPSVVKVRGFFEYSGTAYLIMEYLDGMALSSIVSKNGPMSAKELLPKLNVFLSDLHRLHQSGVIHRDIGPDNVMLMPDGTLKLLDFGCARSMEDGKSMTVLVKEGFAPVEQYMSRGQGAYTDVYALSATIYYTLTGVIPPSSVARLEEDTIKSPNAAGAKLTPEQEEALMWGLTVQPKFRPVNMEVFAARLLAPAAANDDRDDGRCGGKDCPLPPTTLGLKIKYSVLEPLQAGAKKAWAALLNASMKLAEYAKDALSRIGKK